MNNSKTLLWLAPLAFLSALSSARAVPDGYLKYYVPLNASAAGLTFDPMGTLYAVEAAAFQTNTTTLRVIRPDNTFAADIPIVGEDETNLFVGSMTYDPITDGLLITDNAGEGRLYAVSKTGDQQTLATQLPTIAGVAVRATGEIFVSTALGDNLGEVFQIDRATGAATTVLTGLDYGSGLVFDAAGDLLVIEADFDNFSGRIHRLPIADEGPELEFGTAELLGSGLAPGFGLALDSEQDLFATGSGGLFAVEGAPLAATSFDVEGEEFQFSTAVAFDGGSLPFDPFAGADAGRLAYTTRFTDAFVTLIKPTPPVHADFDDSGAVDALDLQVWEMHVGASITASNAMGDSDGDFGVDGTDYLNWQRQFDAGIAGNLTSMVPEPNTWALLAVCVLSTLTRRNTLP